MSSTVMSTSASLFFSVSVMLILTEHLLLFPGSKLTVAYRTTQAHKHGAGTRVRCIQRAKAALVVSAATIRVGSAL